MKSQQILTIVLIAIGAITGSTLATISYLSGRDSVPIDENLLRGADNFSPPSLTPEPEPTAESDRTSIESKPKDFSEFRLSLLDVIKRRDANFIRAIVTPETQWSWDGTINLESHNIDDSQSAFWQYMEKAVGAGCTVEPEATDVWVCPQTFGKSIYNFGWQEQVAILGKSVNIRAEPTTSSSTVGVLSQEIVQFDAETFSSLSQEVQSSVNTPNGWTPIVLPNRKQGWVQNNFIYYEARDYRVSFVRDRGQWRLRYFLVGDGN